MSEKPASTHREDVFPEILSLAAALVLLMAFFLRLWKASGTFLNPDEAMHFLAANKSSLTEAYHASLGLAHPPLLILFLHVWKGLGASELVLRLPSVIAGTVFVVACIGFASSYLGSRIGRRGATTIVKALIAAIVLPVLIVIARRSLLSP